MKRIKTAQKMVLVVGVIWLAAVSAFAQSSVAVMEFTNKIDNQWWYQSGAAQTQDFFIAELIKTKKLNVMDREDLESSLEEKNISISGPVSAASAVKIGRLLGVDYLLTGTITKYGIVGLDGKPLPKGQLGGNTGKGKFSVTFKTELIDVSTGKAVWAREETGETTQIKVSVGGFGSSADDRNTFELAMKPAIQRAVANFKAADLKL
ncbi:MAG: hypothetical protein JSS81_16625 [Acidobacteria bacterium]|nr:hypothetical protein [Acidobacteriota bacterium]